MIVFKLWYLFYFSGSSCLFPYFNIIFRRYHHLTEHQIATLAFIRPFISLPAGSIFSGIADKWRTHNTVLIATFIGASLSRLSVIFTSTYASVIIIMVIADSFTSPVTILVDAAAVAACTHHSEDYARHRLYGAIGWGIFSFIAGTCLQFFGMYSVFLLAGVLSLITLLPTLKIPWEPLHAKLKHSHHENQTTSNVDVNFFSSLKLLFSNPESIIFFSMVTVMGTAVGTIEGFLFLYLEDLHATETLMGLTLTVTCIAESVVFYYTKLIINALGLDGCFHLCFLAFLLRLGSYSTLAWWSSPWWILPVELLHGITFGLTWAAGTAKSALLSPPGLEATTQSAFQGTMFGIGTGLGGLIAGNVYYVYGPQWTFALSFWIVLLGWIATSIASMVYTRNCTRRRNDMSHLTTDGDMSIDIVKYNQIEMIET